MFVLLIFLEREGLIMFFHVYIMIGLLMCDDVHCEFDLIVNQHQCYLDLIEIMLVMYIPSVFFLKMNMSDTLFDVCSYDLPMLLIDSQQQI